MIELQPATILEKHCPSMNNLYLDDQGRNFRDRVVKAMTEYADTKLQQVEQENARLRKALQSIADFTTTAPSNWSDEFVLDIATNALKQTP